ncbi:MAG: hypothetical protein QM766_25745 [Burkholderiaceae bacterium]
MAEIKNYTLNFGSGRPATPALTGAPRRSACTGIERGMCTSKAGA